MKRREDRTKQEKYGKIGEKIYDNSAYYKLIKYKKLLKTKQKTHTQTCIKNKLKSLTETTMYKY